MENYIGYISSGAAFLLAFAASAFGYGKLNQRVDSLITSTAKELTDVKEDFKTFIKDNKVEHQILFDEFRTVVKHMGAVEKFMDIMEKRSNGSN